MREKFIIINCKSLSLSRNLNIAGGGMMENERDIGVQSHDRVYKVFFFVKYKKREFHGFYENI